MEKEVVLCGACIARMKEAFEVQELHARMKITCAQCGKRRYGTSCTVSTRKKKKREV